MEINNFIKILKEKLGCDFFTGVPDSQLKELCFYLMQNEKANHLICANEGNAVGVAAGNYLATGKIPVIYLQNSGIGNIINPVASLLNEKVYGIPCVFVVGWRGEPGVKDEPQHVFQGEITLDTFKVLDIPTIIIDKETNIEELAEKLLSEKQNLFDGKSIAIIVKKGTFLPAEKCKIANKNILNREEVIRHITKFSGEDIIVSTTGKASRELFEIREGAKQSHKYDFLTVGSMGHASSIAYGIAKNVSNRKVWCIDGDGAAIMHLGAMGIIGSNKPSNYVHIVLNNQAHETVGGMPTVASSISLKDVAKACGYTKQYRVKTYKQLDAVLRKAQKNNVLTFIEVCVALGSRADLGRPTTTPKQNKDMLVEYIRGE